MVALAHKPDPRTLGAQCQACPFAKDGAPRHPPVYGCGPKNPEGVFVGEGPGPVEVESGIPFDGPTGKKLDGAMAMAGLARSRMFIMNATLCIPPQGQKTASAMAKATACCLPVFKRHLPPRVPVFTMGRYAWQAFVGKVPKGGLDKGRGFVRRFEGRPYIATIHPTVAFFYDPWTEGAFRVDLARFRRLLDGKLRSRPARENLNTNPTPRDLAKLVKDANGRVTSDDEALPAVWDTPELAALLRARKSAQELAEEEEAEQEEEQTYSFKADSQKPKKAKGKKLKWGYTAKDPTRARLRVVGFGHAEAALAVLWDKATLQMKRAVADLLKNPKVTKVFHNGFWYDLRLNARYDLPVVNVEDTRDARKAINTNSRLSLAYCASLYDDADPWKEDEEEEDDKGLVLTDNIEKLLVYNCLDCVEDARVDDGIRAEACWEDPRVQRLYQVHKQLSVIAAKMGTRGFQVDHWNRGVLAVGLAEEYEARKARFLAWLKDQMPSLPPEFKASPNDLRALLWKRHEREDLKLFSMEDPWDEDLYTPSGTIRVDQKSLITLLVDPSVPEQLKTLLKMYWVTTGVQKARSTFITSHEVDEAMGPDGRVRSSWNTCGPSTGRWSGSSPNLMNLSETK